MSRHDIARTTEPLWPVRGWATLPSPQNSGNCDKSWPWIIAVSMTWTLVLTRSGKCALGLQSSNAQVADRYGHVLNSNWRKMWNVYFSHYTPQRIRLFKLWKLDWPHPNYRLSWRSIEFGGNLIYSQAWLTSSPWGVCFSIHQVPPRCVHFVTKLLEGH